MVVKPVRFPAECVATFALPLRPQNFWIKPGLWAATLFSLWANSVAAQTLLTALEQDMRHLVQIAKPSVVTIMAASANVKKEGGLFGLFRSHDSDTPEFKIGSGLIVSSDGFIVTKESVVREAGQIEIVLVDGQSVPAELVALDSLSEVAVLKANGDKLTPAHLSDAESVQAGSWVAVIGNALGMPQAVSVGVVSAIHENGVIQISANVDPGSNGSPIFNAEGKAVGIVSGRMGLGPEGGNIPENFFSCTALVYPLALCLPRLRDIIRRYYETRGWLGVRVVADAKDQRLPKVLSIVKGSPAERVGIQVGDVITHFTGQPIESFQMLPEMVAACRPGTSENLRVVRGDSVINFNVQIGQQTPVALAELQPAPETVADSDDSKPPIQENFKLENLLIHRRIQALEKELQYLRSLQQKP
jgi:S1-C subfamily serine protease